MSDNLGPTGSKVHLSVVVPVFNEEEILLEMAEGLSPHLDRIAGPGRWQFVLVDNGSTDRSVQICEEIVRKWPESIIICLDKPDYGEALAQGLMRADAPWAFIINVDWWDPAFIGWCFRTRGAYDLVMGSKRADSTLNQQHAYRRLLSWGLNTVLQSVFGFVGTDTHGQKFVYLPVLRPVIKQCQMRRGQFDTEFTLRAIRSQLWLAEAPVPVVELRAPRNLMLHKILRNIFDITQLHRVMRNVPTMGAIRYHRWAREDIEAEDSSRTALLTELGRQHRGATSVTNATEPQEPDFAWIEK